MWNLDQIIVDENKRPIPVNISLTLIMKVHMDISLFMVQFLLILVIISVYFTVRLLILITTFVRLVRSLIMQANGISHHLNLIYNMFIYIGISVQTVLMDMHVK
jgi:hypothetical protein